MRRFFVRSAGAVALVGALGLGTASAFAAEGSGGTADSPNALPAGAISAAVAQQDALANYPGASIVADGVNDQNGVITYGYQVTQNGATYDVQVNALSGAIVQADAGGADGAEAAGAGAAGASRFTTLLPATPALSGADGSEVATAGEGEAAGATTVDAPGGPDVQQGANVQQDGNFQGNN